MLSFMSGLTHSDTQGNEAAHDVEVVFSMEDASDTLEFTNAIVDYLFFLQR